MTPAAGGSHEDGDESGRGDAAGRRGDPERQAPEEGPGDPEQAGPTLVAVALRALDLRDGVAFDVARRRLESLGPRALDPRDVGAGQRVLERQLLEAVAGAWRGGWQPADLVRVCERRRGRTEGALLRAAVGREVGHHPRDRVDARWLAQLRELGIAITTPGVSLLRTTPSGAARPRPYATTTALVVLHLVSRLPQLEPLTPLPGTAPAPAGRGDAGPVDDRVLARVRALLAKAESTPYPAEAETFTAGAQALMTRHSIDAAMVAAAGGAAGATGGRERPDAVRVGVEPPYEAAKAALLSAVASANRCRTVWTRELGFVTVVGFAADLRAVEAVHTSLLVQATAAMNRAGTAAPGGGPGGSGGARSRSRAFRQSFLVAFATRVGQRLHASAREQTDHVAGEPGGDRLLPVLARRDGEVDGEAARLFPATVPVPGPTAHDGAGWTWGWVAAEHAALGAGPGLPS